MLNGDDAGVIDGSFNHRFKVQRFFDFFEFELLSVSAGVIGWDSAGGYAGADGNFVCSDLFSVFFDLEFVHSNQWS